MGMRRHLAELGFVAIVCMGALHTYAVSAGGGGVPPGLGAVSCWSTTACLGVGSWTGTPADNGNPAPMAETWNGSEWVVQPSSDFPSPAAAQFNGVDCSSGTECIAVGDNYTSTTAPPLAELWSGSTWKVQKTAPVPKGSTGAYFGGISCSSGTACTAVGGYVDGSNTRTLAERWNGTAWSLQTMPALAGDSAVALYAVACPTATDCTAVGTYNQPSGAPVILAELWNGSKWLIQNTPALPPSTEASLTAVACPAAKTCTAVGGYSTSTAGYGLIEVWNGLQWGIQASHQGNVDGLTGVACSSNNYCTAVGSTYTGNAPPKPEELPFAERRTTGGWVTQAVPDTSGAEETFPSAIACPSTSVCTTAGTYFLDPVQANTGYVLHDHWTNGYWATNSESFPAILAAAEAQASLPYCFDGGDVSGPTHGDGNTHGATHCGNTNIVGFDCTGLTLYAVYQATGITLPHGLGQDQYSTVISDPTLAQLQVGDLLLFGNSISDYVHTGIYAGNGEMWDANIATSSYPDGVHERKVSWETAAEPLVGAVRFS